MPGDQIKYDKVSKKKSAKKKESTAMKNIVSLRVSDQEKRLLERLTRSTSQNLSDLVREAIGFWLSKRQKVFSKNKATGSTLQMES